MLLAIDIGNTNATFGFFHKENLTNRFSIQTPRGKTTLEIHNLIKENLPGDITDVIISSVVTEVNDSFRELAEKFFNLNPIFVDHTFDFALKIKYNPPSALGTDRIVAAFGAVEKYGKPCIVCDFGTATTIDAVNSRGEYLGGIIVAGMNILADALFLKTSKLPKVKIEKPGKVIGDSTISGIQSGIYFGYAGLVEKLLQKMIKELGEKPKIIATGGLASTIAESVEMIETVDKNLMLEGLRLIYEKVFQHKDTKTTKKI
jgi:type III pantothenate kinase